MVSLPLDILLCISQQLGNSKHTHSNLALLNSDTYRVIIPSLYRSNQLHYSKIILLFLTSIINNPRLGPMVESLFIGASIQEPDLPDISQVLHTALVELVNLINLGLAYPKNPFLDPSEYPRYKSDSKLRCLIAYPYPRQDLNSFLQRHNSLTHLMIPNMRIPGTELSFSGFRSAGEMVPELSNLTGPASRVMDLLISRPVKKVEVELDMDIKDIISLASLKFALGESTGPVNELILRQGSLKSYGFWTLIKFDPTSPLLSNLRQLTLQINEPVYEEIWKYHAKDLGSYQVLEHLTIQASPGLETAYEFDSLGELSHLKFWQSHCRSLLTVEIFGTSLS